MLDRGKIICGYYAYDQPFSLGPSSPVLRVQVSNNGAKNQKILQPITHLLREIAQFFWDLERSTHFSEGCHFSDPLWPFS